MVPRTLNSSVSEAASKEVEIEIPIASPTGLSEGGNIHDNVGGYSSKSLGQYAQDKWPPEQELPVHSFLMEYLTEQQGPSAVLGDRLILATQPMGFIGALAVFRPGQTTALVVAGHHTRWDHQVVELTTTQQDALAQIWQDHEIYELPVKNGRHGFDGMTFVADLHYQNRHMRLAHWSPDNDGAIGRLRDLLIGAYRQAEAAVRNQSREK